MSEPNPSAVAAYRRSIEKTGVRVRFKRETGEAPNAVFFAAEVMAIVRDAAPAASAGAPQGYNGSLLAVTLDKRQVIVMAEDLQEKRFPLPLVKADQIYVFGNEALLTIDDVDAEKRSMGGAIEIMASGAP
ncbi:MAG: hypothetical protein WDN29_16270 [Methylovirgula sp.]